jgi:hypothetical protein
MKCFLCENNILPISTPSGDAVTVLLSPKGKTKFKPMCAAHKEAFDKVHHGPDARIPSSIACDYITLEEYEKLEAASLR